MPSLPANLDTASMAAICAVLMNLKGQEFIAARNQVEKRFQVKMALTLGGYTSDESGSQNSGNSTRRTFHFNTGSVAPTAVWETVFYPINAAFPVLRLRKITLVHPGSQTTAALAQLELRYVTVVPTAGGSVPNFKSNDEFQDTTLSEQLPWEDLEANLTTLAMDVGNQRILQWNVWTPAAMGPFTPVVIGDWTNSGDKAPTCRLGQAKKGFAIRNAGAAGATALYLDIEYTTEAQ